MAHTLKQFLVVVSVILSVGFVRASPLNEDEYGVFWQVTDIHYDANYSQYPSPHELCHVQYEDKPRGHSAESGNGHFGDYNCDSPWSLVMSAIDAMKTLQTAEPDFILWTGDNVPHVPDEEVSLPAVYHLIQNVTRKLSATFPDTPIFPCLGNHDTWPANQYHPGPDHYYSDILLQADWQQVIARGQQEQFKQGGFYTVKSKQGLRIISLNSNLWYNMDNLTANLTDPAGQFAWLEGVLKQARKDGEKVLLASHVPPGVLARAPMRWFYPEYNTRFLGLLREHSDVIQTGIFGHEHTDSFRVVRGENGTPVTSLFMAPAVTPWRSTVPGLGANNPALRLYYYHRHTGAVLDYSQYYFNLSLANSAPATPWVHEYRARDVYKLDSLAPGELQRLVITMETKDDIFNKYYQFNSVSYDPATCEGDCKHKHLCAINYADYSDYDKCVARHGAVTDDVNDVDGDDMTSYMNHHKRHRKYHHVPQFMFIVIIMLVIVIVILFVILAIVCLRRRHAVTYMRQPRYVLIKPDEP